MSPRSPFGCFSVFILVVSLACTGWWAYSSAAPESGARVGYQSSALAVPGVARPRYEINARIDYDLLTLKSKARVTIPVDGADPLTSASFFMYANAGGVGGDDARRKNLVVDAVTFNGQAVKWTLTGAVLKVALPSPQTSAFALDIDYHGVVPRSAGGDADMFGALSMDVSSLLGGGGQQAAQKPKNTDYGLYTYGNGILSLGSFWYPQLAVRQQGRWADSQPEGLGDVAFSDDSDYQVTFAGLPAEVTIAAPGTEQGRTFTATGVREFAVLMSEDYVAKKKNIVVGGKPVALSSYALKANAGRLNQSLDIAEKALQIYAKRYGQYSFDQFKVVEAPMKGGAGGMEYSSMVGIASMLYGDMGKQLSGMMTTLDIPGASDLLKGLDADAGMDQPAGKPAAPKAAPKQPAAPAEEGGANALTDMVGGILGQQKDMMDSLFEVTIAHEVAHQWWAIGVGSDSQRYPFVDESLTNWSAMLYFEDRYGKEKAEAMTDLHLKTSYSMGVMLGGGDAPANLRTSAYRNNMQYGAIIYGKAALFYGKLRELVGDEAFFGALRDYYARYNGGIAGPDTLHGIFTARVPGKKAAIDGLYARWISEKHGQEDIGSSSALGGLDLNGILGSLMGGGGAGDVE